MSIVINNYNYGRFLGRSIESALSQSYPRIEVVVVDDGSTDESREILSGYSSRVAVVLKPNGGQASAFNAGVAKATGDFILLLDSDDYLFPDAISTCVSAYPEGYSRVYFRMRLVDDEDRPIEADIPAARFKVVDGDLFADTADTESLFLGPPTSGNFFDASVLRSVLPVPEDAFRICADAFVLMKTSLKGPVRGIDVELGAYRIHRDNAFSSRSSLFSNPRRVEVQIGNYFRTVALLQDAWASRGREWQPAPPYLHFWNVHLFCAGWAWTLPALHAHNVTWRVLVRMIGKYLFLGTDRFRKRVLQTTYALLLITLPRPLSRKLLGSVDTVKFTRPRKSPLSERFTIT